MVISSGLSRIGQRAEKHPLYEIIICCKVGMAFARICYMFSVEIKYMLIASLEGIHKSGRSGAIVQASADVVVSCNAQKCA